MCIRCLCITIKEEVEENYLFNREKIVQRLFNMFSFETSTVDDEKFVSDNDKQKHKICFEKLMVIRQMIENGSDKNDILYELEILEGSMDFLQRHAQNEQSRQMRGNN